MDLKSEFENAKKEYNYYKRKISEIISKYTFEANKVGLTPYKYVLNSSIKVIRNEIIKNAKDDKEALEKMFDKFDREYIKTINYLKLYYKDIGKGKLTDKDKKVIEMFYRKYGIFHRDFYHFIVNLYHFSKYKEKIYDILEKVKKEKEGDEK